MTRLTVLKYVKTTFISEALVECRVSSEAFPLPGYPDVSLPAELVVASEEDPVVGEPDAVLAGALRGWGKAEEDVPGICTAGEVRGNQALRVLRPPHSSCQHHSSSLHRNYQYIISIRQKNLWLGLMTL